MREIKFRYIFQHNETGRLITFNIHSIENLESKGLQIPHGYSIIARNQYTDLKDKNGKKIYEEDILRDDVGGIHEVIFGKLPLDKRGDCVCTYQSFYAKCYGKLGMAPSCECTEIGKWMEIIGNIYENSELLG